MPEKVSGVYILRKSLTMAKYNKKIVEHICELISIDSFTISEICKRVGIAERTYYDWLKKNADFADAIKKAQDKFDELIASEAKKSLVKMIRGYTVQEKRVITVDTGKLNENNEPITRVKESTTTDKHYQPIPAAVIFALTNRDPDNWKNRQDTKVSADVGIKSHLENLSDDELQKIIDGETE